MIEKLEGQDLLPDEAAAAPGESGAAEPAARGVPRDTALAQRVPAAGAEAAPARLPAAEHPAGEEPPSGEESIVPVEAEELRGAIEAILFSVSEPIPIRTLAEVVGVSVHEVREAVEDLRLEYIDMRRAFRLEDIAGGVQILTVGRFDPWIRRLRQKERESRLSSASLETLAVIAYKQPISRADLEAIRGVGCGPTLKTLLERGLIQISGRSDALGRPLLYGTTRRFLESFGIASVRDLPQPEGALPLPAAGASAALEAPAGPVEGSAPAPAALPASRPASTPPPEPSLVDSSGPLS